MPAGPERSAIAQLARRGEHAGYQPYGEDGMSNDKTEIRSVEPAPQPAPAPPSIPGVTLGVKLGEGGMAVVYEGQDLGFRPPRRVAVKLMSAELSGQAEFRVRFEREAAVVAEFRHDNIVHVYASGEAGGAKYLVMEYLSGGTLAERIRSEPLSLQMALGIAATLADALAYSHARGIVHRDFKPANVLMTADHKPVLSDFGVAKATAGEATELTQHRVAIGAPRYMSPEQASGAQVTDRSDVYSWGLTLVELITGFLPPNYRAQPPDGDSAEWGALHSSAPREIVDLISRCLQFDPARRPSACECAAQLRAVMARSSQPETPSSGPPRSWLRRSLVVAIAGVVAIAALLLLFDPDIRRERVIDSSVLTVTRQPTTARVFVDDIEVRQSAAQLSPGAHRLIAVAPGYYGEAKAISLTPGTNPAVNVSLAPVGVPTAAEHDQFLKLADAASVSAADLDTVRERTLRTALQLKFLRQEASVELQQLRSDIDALTRRGDLRAPVVALLARSMEEGRLSRSLVTDSALLASDSGDAMASFFVAAALRDELRDAAIDPDNSDFRDYCRRLRLSIQQGWSVATERWQRDRCVE